MGKNNNAAGKKPRSTGVSKGQLKALNARIDRAFTRHKFLLAEFQKLRKLQPETKSSPKVEKQA